VPDWQTKATVRHLADEVQPALEDDDTFIDQVAVTQFIQGKTSVVTPLERLEAVRQAALMGISYLDLDALHGLRSGSTSTFISRTRKRYEACGKKFPEIVRPSAKRCFSEAEVIEIRERAAAGATRLELAVSFDTTRDTIRAVCQGRTYSQYGGPVCKGPSAEGAQKSREFMCGHADNSQAGTKQHEMGEAA
jgi:hypothetical protein